MARSMFRAALAAGFLAVSGLFVAAGPAAAQTGQTVVFAAASMKTALDEIVAQWGKETGKKAVVSYAASSALAKQMEAGAPAELFVSADLDWMDYVEKKGLMRAGTRSNLLGNSIVLVAEKGRGKPVNLAQGLDLAGLLGGGRLAMGQVATVPAGKYGKAALEKLGLWGAVSGKIAEAESVRAALALVSRGEAPYGIVYATDAAADPAVEVVASFPADSHPPIIYPAALTMGASVDAASLLEYLKSDKAGAAFRKQGFTVLP